jgi:Domain of unknown function (DUF4153)
MGERWSTWWQRRIPDVGAAAVRFPLAVTLAAALTFYKLGHDNPGDAELRVLGALAASFLWVVAADLYVEANGRSHAARIALWLCGIVVIAVLFKFSWEIWFLPPLLIGALLLLVGLAAHLGRGESNSTFWLFNHRLWLGALLALAGGVLLGAGLSAIHATLNLLFGLGLSSRWLERIWTVSLGFVAPVSFLAFAPRRFNDKITEREEQDFTMRAAAALVKFVLVPLLLVYTAILYAYAVKIALAWELPKGTLAAMVVAYLFVGAVTLLLGFPSRDEGGPLLRFFWRHWVLLVALPVVLLFIAVSRRIADYGLTEERYMIVLVGVWALILAAIRIARGPDFDLRLLPGVLALLLIAASFGPGGAIGFSVMSQKAELASILAAKNMLAGGKFVPAAPGEKDPLGQDAARVRAIEWYLNAHRSLAVLAPWFEGQKDDPFAPGKTPEESVRGLLAAFGLTPTLGGGGGALAFNHQPDTPAIVSLGTTARLIGPVVFQTVPKPLPIPVQTVAVEGFGPIEVELHGNAVEIRMTGGERLSFDLAEAVREIENRKSSQAKDTSPIALKASSGGVSATMLIDRIVGTYEPEFSLASLRFWLVLDRAG